MDIIGIEQALVNIFMEKLNLEKDKTIFRGDIPSSVNCDAICIMIESEIKSNIYTARAYNMQILGKFQERDNAMRMLSKINEIFPKFGLKSSPYTFANMLARGGGDIYTDTDNGVQKYFITYNFQSAVLTTGAQV